MAPSRGAIILLPSPPRPTALLASWDGTWAHVLQQYRTGPIRLWFAHSWSMLLLHGAPTSSKTATNWRLYSVRQLALLIQTTSVLPASQPGCINFSGTPYPPDVSSANYRCSTSSTRHCHPFCYSQLQPRIQVYQYAFYPRIIPVWNRLPEQVVTIPTTKGFQVDALPVIQSLQPPVGQSIM